MKTLIKIIPIVIILVIFLIIKNNPLNKVKWKLYLNEASGTGAYFEGKKVSLIVEGEDGGEFKLAMKWKNILFYHKEESNFYQIFILKGDTLYFISMHTSEIERIGGVSGLQVDEYNKEYYIPLKLVKDINSYYNSLGNKINNEKANNERANNKKVNNKGIERYAGSWCMNYSGENELLFVISSDGNINFSDGQVVKAKDITKVSDTSYSFENNDGTIELDFYEDINCSMTTYSQDKAGFVIDLIKNN